ncbi:non-specific lipid transfer protein GPI-anchored 29-like [Andrographis paniculata]|uniref:non-specific lipid transfer protein GPI-anchored 29-like n=1 Tax=Andrographis paniculata TaxID=175694 RepID=UPI0021E82384|nr:non-specific lipid transfer protein GPI-anchored 29-like [Andrographis paniculata]
MKIAATVVAVIAISAAALFPVKASDCKDALNGLQVCFSYLSNGGGDAPSTQCCSQLQGVIKTQPICLCQISGEEEDGLNKTRARQLPTACKIQNLPTSSCKTTRV